jgi:hypothetical protein
LFQKVSIITKNSGADPNTLNNTANKRAIRYLLFEEGVRRVELGVKEDKNARFSKEPERCIERKWGDGSLKEKWIQPEVSTVPQPEADYGTPKKYRTTWIIGEPDTIPK